MLMAIRRMVVAAMADESYGLKQVQVRLKLAETETLYSSQPMSTPERAAEVMADMLAQLDRECCCVVNLDNSLRPLNFNIVSIGGINQALIPVQNVFKAAILSNASSVMLFHNHPSGNLNPSREDVLITQRLLEAGRLMQIPVNDHIIVGGGTGKQYSFRIKQPWMFSEENKTFLHEVNAFMQDGMVKESDRVERYSTATSEPSKSEQKKIKVLLVEPGKYPQEVYVENTLEALQNVVGGKFDCLFPFAEPVSMITNTESKTHGEALNRALYDAHGKVCDVIAGKFIVVGLGDDNFCSLTKEQLNRYEKIFHQPEAFVRMGKGITAVPITGDKAKGGIEDQKKMSVKKIKEQKSRDIR